MGIYIGIKGQAYPTQIFIGVDPLKKINTFRLIDKFLCHAMAFLLASVILLSVLFKLQNQPLDASLTVLFVFIRFTANSDNKV